MFTGIVETVGRVVALTPKGNLTRIEVEAPPITEGVGLGDSVAVNGACLTVVSFDPARLAFEAVQETMARTSLGELAEGSSVNLERAMLAGGRLDGHIVQGHVDGVGTITAFERSGDDVRLAVGCDDEMAQYLVPKGSVTIDGVSLTVVNAEDAGFDVALIPHTLEVTTLGKRSVGDRVNLEADIIGKYVKRYLDRVSSPAAGVDA